MGGIKRKTEIVMRLKCIGLVTETTERWRLFYANIKLDSSKG